MASEQQQQQPGAQGSPDSHLRPARIADTAASAALCASHPERNMSARDPIVTELQLIRPAKETGSGADLSHASAGAALAHAKSSHYTGGKKKKDVIRRDIPDIKDYDATVASQLSWEGRNAASAALRDHRAVTAPSATLTASTCYLPGRGSLEEIHRNTGHKKAVSAASGAFTNSIKRRSTVPGRSPAPSDVSTRRMRLGGQDTYDTLGTWAEASRISQVASTNAQLYTSIPSASLRLEEQDKKGIEHAAAVSMAQGGYYTSRGEEKQRLDTSLYGPQTTPGRLRAKRVTTISDPVALQQAVTLQYAAQKLAAEKIAGMYANDANYQQYYGTEPQPVRSRLSVRKKRPPSIRETSRIDMERSMAIRNQMSTLQNQVHAVDEQRQRDRDHLMEAARKNVDAVIHDMELKVFAETGRPPSSLPRKMGPTEHERQVSETEFEYTDKIYIGPDHYIGEADLEAAAWANVRPALDEMDDRVAEKRAREIEGRRDKDEDKRHQDAEHEREASIKSEEDRMKADEHAKERRELDILPAIGNRAKRKEEQRRASKEEELKAREVENELDKEQRKRRRSIEREREADTRAVEKEILMEKREEEKRRASQRKSNRVSERKPSAEREESTRAEERGPSLERDTTAAATESNPESQIEASASSRADALPEMTRSQTAEGQNVDVFPESVTGSGATISKKPESKFRTWFKDRLGRRPREAEQGSMEREREREKAPGPTGGAALAPAEDARGAALSSHPVTGVDLAQMQNGRTNGNGDFGQLSTSEDLNRQLSKGEKPLSNGENRRSRFRASLMRIVSRNSQEPKTKTNGVSAHDEDTSRHSRGEEHSHHDDQGHHDVHRHAAAEREDLRESAAEQGLLVPPAIGERGSYSTARESRFSEDL